MTKQQGVTIRYSISFKQKVIREIEEEGLTNQEAARKYGIKGGSTIANWLKKYGKNHLLNKVVRVEMKGEKDEVKRLEQELSKLKEAYADLSLKYQCNEKIIELATDELSLDLKKNFGESASGGSKNNIV